MTELNEKILKEALSLPSPMRIKLIEKLIQSLNIPINNEIDDLWTDDPEKNISAILQMIKNIPDDAYLEDIIEAIYVRKKNEKGLKDSEESRLYFLEEAKEILKKGLK